MKTQEIKIAENFSDFKQIAKDNNIGPVGMIAATMFGFGVATIFRCLFCAYHLFNIRARKTDHYLSTDRYLYAIHPKIFTKGFKRRENRPYIRTRMRR